MILKSFFRNKITKVYFLIFIVLFTIVILTSSFLGYYINLENDLFSNRSILVIISEDDAYDELKRNSCITDIKQKNAILPDKNYNIIVDSDYTFANSNGSVVDKYENSDESSDYKIKWNNLILDGLDYVIVSPDDSNELGNGEVSIGLNSTWFEYYKDYFYKFLNKKIGFKTLDENIEFNLVNFHQAIWPEIKISRDQYNELLERQQLFVYVAKVTSYKEANKIKSQLESKYNNENERVLLESSYQNQESTEISNIDDLIGILKLVSYIIAIIFFVILFVIINNILIDFNSKILIERKLGFSIKQVLKNNFVRLLTLYLVSFVIAIFVSIIISTGIRFIFDIKLILFGHNFVLIILGLGLLINLFSILLNITRYCRRGK